MDDLSVRAGDRVGTMAVAGFVAVWTWAAVAVLHPTSFDGAGNGMWLAVHVTQFLLAPVVAMGVLGLLGGIDSSWATVPRRGAVLWAVWFAVYDAVAGVSTGLLAGSGLPNAAFALTDAVLVGVLGLAAPILWLLTMASASVALRGAGAPRSTSAAVFLGLLVAVHAGLPAASGFAALGFAFRTGRSSDRTFDRWRLS